MFAGNDAVALHYMPYICLHVSFVDNPVEVAYGTQMTYVPLSTRYIT